MIHETIKILLLAAIIVYGIDASPFYRELSSRFVSLITKGRDYFPIIVKPFGCSLCATFWGGIIVLIVDNCFTLPMIAIVCVVSWITPLINALFMAIERLIDKLTEKLSQ